MVRHRCIKFSSGAGGGLMTRQRWYGLGARDGLVHEARLWWRLDMDSGEKEQRKYEGSNVLLTFQVLVNKFAMLSPTIRRQREPNKLSVDQHVKLHARYHKWKSKCCNKNMVVPAMIRVWRGKGSFWQPSGIEAFPRVPDGQWQANEPIVLAHTPKQLYFSWWRHSLTSTMKYILS
jgi:hypothetical protein